MSALPRLRLASARSGWGLAVVCAVLLAHAASFAAALAGAPTRWLASATVALVLDLFVARRRVLRTLFGGAQLGLMNRVLLREAALLVLVFRVPDPLTSSRSLVAAAVLALVTARFGLFTVRVLYARRRLRPVEWRNVDVPLPEAWVPPRVACAGLDVPVVLTSVPVLLAGVGLASGVWWPFPVAVLLALLALTALAAPVVLGLLRRRVLPPDDDYVDVVNAAVRELHPQVVLYFSGPAVAMYQLNMWLPVLEATHRRCLIILRERLTLRLMNPTSLPIVCLPSATRLMDFRVPTVRVGLYAVNVGKNLHYMREPRVKHVFIGHGESDKIASVNPFTKVHDEIWVAGQAARDRWAAADVGVRDETIVEVGRPQLGAILPARSRADSAPLTVLYAPTWEGWTDDPFASSLLAMGPDLVRWLLGRPAPTRLIYKPHPLTGTVSAQARTSHAEIKRLLAAAGAQQTSASVLGVDIGTSKIVEETLESESARLRSWRERRDTPPGLDPRCHLVVSGATPTLFECFNAADVLISDISSVVGDFIASAKPYVVTNPADRDHDEFRGMYATARAAYLADPHPASWEPMMQLLTGVDPLAQSRLELRTYLLGPSEPDSLSRWNAAVDRLIEHADAQWPDAERESAIVHLD